MFLVLINGGSHFLFIMLIFTAIMITLVTFVWTSNMLDYPPERQPLKIEIITLAFMGTNLYAGLPYVGPAFDLALEEIRSLYPQLNITQRILGDQRYRTCNDWSVNSDNVIASYFYRRILAPVRDKADVVAVISSG